MTYSWTRQAIHLIGLCALGSALATPASATLFSGLARPTVQTSQGTVAGKVTDGVRAYLGIPYAAPPVGDLRWQSPQPPQAWSGTRDARAFGERCAQPFSALSPESVNEDCLFLNVHVPDDIGNRQLPVMVWIHGGAFLSGSAEEYKMAHLARKAGAVVVSINYRLGAFGFFRAPEAAAQNQPSNLGLEDQQAALRWVQSQIGRFGGDASKVTLFGQSAGGASVCLHTVSPPSRGLFHRAIIQSGSCRLLTWTPAAVMEAQSSDLGVKLGCPQGAGQLACLRQKSAEEVMRASVPNGYEVRDVDIRWTPVADGLTLTGDPHQQIEQGQFYRVPTMIGTTRDEGRLFVGLEYHLASLRLVRPSEVEDYIIRIAGDDTSKAALLRSTYTAQAYGTRDLAFSAMLTDYYFSCDAMREAEAFARHVPTYHYELTERYLPTLPDPLMPLGAMHGAELMFVLPGSSMAAQIWPLSSAQRQLSDQMMRYWGQFAATGNPNGPGASTWPAFQAHRDSSLALDSRGLSVFGAAAFRQAHRCDVIEASSTQ